ncbi:hypothetical protein RZ532_00465 [Nitratireductor aquimarinus]|uniref:hypothetical protein n=1 Tax=Nitratireductor aquimarinus TaxID=889300 RepID=UPI002936BF48|nr:hypothetical protein [Nitratireductor aquimarinus]MDV2964433.1 hypothetical protein [Nitratireductor aquimarinus]
MSGLPSGGRSGGRRGDRSRGCGEAFDKPVQGRDLRIRIAPRVDGKGCPIKGGCQQARQCIQWQAAQRACLHGCVEPFTQDALPQ